MKNITLTWSSIVIAASLMLSSFSFKMATTDFTGKWKLNESKSELGQFANFAVRAIESTQSKDSLSISRTSNTFEGTEATTQESIALNGKETESSSFGNSKKKSTASWSDDGKTMTITYNLLMDFNGQSTEIKGTEVWTISETDKTLTVNNTANSSFGEFAMKCVYDKQ